MSSLQKQLAAIAATSTHQLDLKAQKVAHGRSLLFEPRVAASQLFDSIYLICHEGFRDLCALDRRFLQFEKTIFSEQSKSEDRTQMTKEENAELDAALESFISLVGPRLLLKPAEKALEWLVRRFRVHEYNTESLVLTYLPYHATPQFLALLSILPAQPSHTLRFLQPYITSPTNPPRQAIVYTAVNTPSFFAALQGYVVKALQNGHQGSPLLSFWAGITTQAVDAILDQSQSGRRSIQDQKTEDVLLRVLPALNECLRIDEAPEAIMGCYMIIIVLVTKGSFEDKVLDALMEAVVRSQAPAVLEGCLMCLAVISEERSHSVFPTPVWKRLLRIPNLAKNIKDLASKCRVERISLGCALGAIENISCLHLIDESQALYLEIAQAQLVSQDHVLLTLSVLLKSVQESAPGSAQHTHLLELVTQLSEIDHLSKTVHPFIRDHSKEFGGLGASIEQSLEAVDIANSESDEEMHDVDEETNRMSDKPKVSPPEIKVDSFLDCHSTDAFQAVLAAFERTTASYRQAREFLDSHQLARQDAIEKPLFLSFLARTWCSPTSVQTKVAALRATIDLIKESGGKADLQNLIPYLLHALADPSQIVRSAAASCIRVLSKEASALAKQLAKQPNPPVWGSSNLYGRKTYPSRNLPPGDGASSLLSRTLVPILEECVIDHRFVINSIREALEEWPTSSRKGRRNHALKGVTQPSLFLFLAGHLATTPILRLRVCLLPLLSFHDGATAHTRADLVLPVIQHWFSLPATKASTLAQNERLDVAEVDKVHVNALIARELGSIDTLSHIASGLTGEGRFELQALVFDRIIKLWSSIKYEPQLRLAQSLLDLATRENGAVGGGDIAETRAQETLRTVTLNPDILLTFLEHIPSALHMPEGPPTKKRRRTSRNEAARVELQSPEDVTKLLRRLTLVLELVEGSDPAQNFNLFKNLFSILGDLQQLKQQSGSDLVYLQSLILNSLTPIVNELKGAEDSAEYEAAVRVDLLIDCIRHSSNPQVQNAALLLIASLASWVPEQVLHNLMPIFTFIGSTLLRQQDDYSAHVVDQTISKVVPQLAASLRAKHKDFVIGVADLLLSFTAAFEHIPHHRRLRLFSELAQTLGPQASLPAIIALLVDRYPASKAQKKFVPELLLKFEPAVTLEAFKGYLSLVTDAVGATHKVFDTLFSFNERQPAQIESAVNNLLSFLADLASDASLRRHISRAFRKSGDQERSRATFAHIVEAIVQLSARLPRNQLYATCSRVLSNCLDLLPTVDLVRSVELLLANTDHKVQVAAINSIEVRASSVTQNDQHSVSSLLSFLPKLDEVLQKSEDIEVKNIAVSCIDRIIEQFGKKDPSAVEVVARTVAGAHSLLHSDDRVRVLSLICLTSVVDVLEEESISLLPIVLPTAFGYLKESIEGENPELHNAVFEFLSNGVKRLAFMFSREYLVSTLELAHQSAAADLEESCDENRQRFYDVVAKQIDAKEAFSAFKATWASAISHGSEATSEHLDLIHSTIDAQSKSKLVKTSSSLFNLFIEVFDLRQALDAQIKSGAVNEDELEQLETSLIASAITMVSKLNDATFRPFFIQLVDWATSSKSKPNVARSITLHRFLGEFFEHFKSIVTSYSTYILQPASTLLTWLTTTPSAPTSLLNPLLLTLQTSFTHDQDSFWQTPSHNTTILTPLLTLLTLPSTPSHLIPTITALAAASASSIDNHREMNTQLLKLMKSESATTRLAVVKTEMSLTERLGDEWLSLLPEMLPLISELREDDDEFVERETQRWIGVMEGILGESLEGMLQ